MLSDEVSGQNQTFVRLGPKVAKFGEVWVKYVAYEKNLNLSIKSNMTATSSNLK